MKRYFVAECNHSKPIEGASLYALDDEGEPIEESVFEITAEQLPRLREENANAALIAAAPDLLEALRSLYQSGVNTPALDSSSDWTDILTKARQAIAKAEGKEVNQ